MLNVFLELIPVGLVQGLILGLIAVGVMIPFKLLNFPDLTAEGSYPLGGALCASLLVLGVQAGPAVLISVVLGGAVGVATAWIHLRFKVNTLLAGIILSTMIYSVNLRMMGKPNLALFQYFKLFSSLPDNIYLQIFILLLVNAAVISLLYNFLLTERGLQFRAVGLNSKFAAKQGIKLSPYVMLGLFLGNALISLAGSLMVQIQGYADVGMGVRIVIHALAAVMIGESIIKPRTLCRQALSPLIGAVIYQQIQGLVLSFSFSPTDLKFFTGLIVLFFLGSQSRRG